MQVKGSRRALAIILGALLVPMGGSAATGTTAPTDEATHLGSALSETGEFVGAQGVSGSVDTNSWRLVSDLTAGEPPRFEPAGTGGTQGLIPADGSWSALGSDGAGSGAITDNINALAFVGSNLYVAGSFLNAANINDADYIARWNGTSWSAVGDGLNSYVTGMAVSGTNLYVAGNFEDAGGNGAADKLARWNGSNWSALGSNGFGNGVFNSTVNTVAISGTDVYVGGLFFNVNSIAEADHVARWNGSAWSALGSNGSADGALNSAVAALVISGTDLYAAGFFQNVGGTAEADYVARWNGSAWSALGGTGNGALGASAFALAVTGTDVYVGGAFTNVAGITQADFVARWSGSAWSALGSDGGINGALTAHVSALAHDGTNLYVAGAFSNAGVNPEADYIARWSGSAWSALGSDGAGDGALDNAVHGLAILGDNLFAGGEFVDVAGINTADHVAVYGPAAAYQPDGRIKKGTSALIGNNIYNADGTNQTKSGKAARGSTIKFTISIQNDGDTTDRFTVDANGAAAANYSVKYFRGTTNITTAVVAGTYQTSNLAPGATLAITAKVKVLSGATVGSSVTRLVTLTSVGDGATVDAVKFIGKRN